MVDLTDHELTRRNLWIHAATSDMSHVRYDNVEAAALSADKLLEEYDKRFKEPKEETNATKTRPKQTAKSTTPKEVTLPSVCTLF